MGEQVLLLATTGTLSTSHWLLAAFVGMARPLGRWPLEALLTGYAAYCAATLLVAAASVPVLRRSLARPHRPESRAGLDVLLPTTTERGRGVRANA